ncbi:rhodanese-like domain-containing protein [Geomobilimonas luticola]|uniref:Rhodanese domain-containing protein n=1 Tax=Geomobilimonas luticola TaxID=1114878 RepID=A0ABS5S9K0_9BACT|nr:rhodanese-like domain-containing protein [Geomobilimonas luticola]MBT0652042.1 hypothetical protein [Geomobilimonas luticola]
MRWAIAYACIGTLLFLLQAAPAFCSGRFEGRLLSYAQGFLLIRDGNTDRVVRALQGTSLKNFTELSDLRDGDLITVSFESTSQGVVPAVSLERVLEREAAGIPAVTSRELFEFMDHRVPYMLIDLRERNKFTVSHIPTAVWVADGGTPLTLTNGAGEMPIILYGADLRDDRVARVAAKFMQGGNRGVKVLSGGLERWQYDGYPVATTMENLKRMEQRKEPVVFIDCRPPAVAGEGSIPGAMNVPPGKLSGDLLVRGDGGYPLVFFGSDMDDGSSWFQAMIASMIGYTRRFDAPVMILEGGLAAWRAAGKRVQRGELSRSLEAMPRPPAPAAVAPGEFREEWGRRDSGILLLDVRNHDELPARMPSRVAIMPLSQLPERLHDLPNDKQIFVYCKTGRRARIAWHILTANGFQARYYNHPVTNRQDGSLE